MVVRSHSSVQLRSVEHTGAAQQVLVEVLSIVMLGHKLILYMVPTGNRSKNEDDTDELRPIEAVRPCKLYHCLKRYLGLFPGEVGQMYALLHVCLVLAAVSNLLT